MAKAANLLFAKHYASTKPEKPNFTESDMSEALQAVGLLIYLPPPCLPDVFINMNFSSLLEWCLSIYVINYQTYRLWGTRA